MYATGVTRNPKRHSYALVGGYVGSIFKTIVKMLSYELGPRVGVINNVEEVVVS